MADFYDMLAGSLLGEEAYLAKNPYYTAGAGVLKAPMPAATTNLEALLGPAVQGLIGGALAGYGKEDARQQAYKAYSDLPFSQNIMTGRVGAPYGPLTQAQEQESTTPLYGKDAAPEGWSIETARPQILINMLQAKSIQDIQNKNVEALNKLLLEYSPEATALKANAEGAIARAKEGKDWIQKAPQSVLTQATKIEGVSSQLQKLADEFDTLGSSAVKFQVRKNISGTKENELSSKMNQLLPSAVKMLGETGNLAEQEQARILTSTLGNTTSNTKEIATRLRNLGSMAKTINISSLEATKSAIEEGGDDLLSRLKQSAAQTSSPVQPNFPTPPPGYELTGKRDAHGNYGIRKIK